MVLFSRVARWAVRRRGTARRSRAGEGVSSEGGVRADRSGCRRGPRRGRGCSISRGGDRGQQGVEADEQFAGDGDTGDLRRFTACTELLVAGPEGFVPTSGDDGALVEDAPGRGATVLNTTQAAHLARIPGQRGEPGEFGDLPAVARAQLGQVGEQLRGIEHADPDGQALGLHPVPPGLGRALQPRGQLMLECQPAGYQRGDDRGQLGLRGGG